MVLLAVLATTEFFDLVQHPTAAANQRVDASPSKRPIILALFVPCLCGNSAGEVLLDSSAKERCRVPRPGGRIQRRQQGCATF